MSRTVVFLFFLLLFLPPSVSICIFGVGNCQQHMKESRPFSDQKDKTWFLPRAIVFLSYYLPPRDDGTIKIWPEERKNEEWREMMPEEKEYFDKKVKTMKTEKNPNWEASLAMSWNYAQDKDGQLFRKNNLENPTFRKTKQHRKCPEKGDKVFQLFIESGVPFEVPCFMCNGQHYLLNDFHFLPKRDFYDQQFDDRRERFPNETDDPSTTYQVPVMTAILDSLHNALLNKFSKGLMMIQSIRRDIGGQKRIAMGVYSSGTGNLQIDPLNSFYQTTEQELKTDENKEKKTKLIQQMQALQAVNYGVTFQCVESKEGIKKATGVAINVDSLVRVEKSTYAPANTYSIYETWDNNWDLTGLVFQHENLKDYGRLFSHLVYSIKMRKGYLSLKKLKEEEPVDFGYSFLEGNYTEQQVHLERLLGEQPYSEMGIPLYSTLVPQVFREKLHEKFTSKFITIWNSTANTTFYGGAGFFVQQKSCQNEHEKFDCATLAKCRGIQGYEKMKKETEKIDPCSGSAFTLLILNSKFSNFKVEEGHNYRLIIDDTEFHVGQEVNWEIQRKPVNRYDYTKECDKQGSAVHPNNLHLLITHLHRKDLQAKVLAYLKTGEVLSVTFNNFHEKEIYKKSIRKAFIWSGVIFGILILLTLFIVLMYKLRVWRIRQSLIKKKKDFDRPTEKDSESDVTENQ